MTARCEKCGEHFESRRRARFCSPACRTAAWKERNGYRDRRAVAQASRNANRTVPRPPDMRLGYSKVLEAVAQDFVRVGGFDLRYARRRAAETLAPLLSDRQRQHLQERDA